MKQLKYVIFVVATLFVVAPQVVFAEPIEVLNPSFEYSDGEDIDIKTMGICPDDWTYDPVGCIGLEAEQTSGIEGEPVEDGVCVALYGVESIYQTTDYTIGAGDEYTLLFDAFWLWAGGTEVTYQGQLYYDDAGSHELLGYVEESITGGMDWVWHTDITLNVTVPLGSPAIGKKLGVELATTVFGAGWFGFDTVRLDVEKPTTAVNVYPTDGSEYISPAVVLEWAAPSVYTPIYYDVYRSTDPNCNLPEYMVLNHADQLTYDDPCDLDFGTEYYWSVVTYESSDVNYPGSVWGFKTMPAEPVFTTDAEHTLAAEGGSAVFSVVSPNADSFQWYKAPSTLLSHGGDISIVSDATSSTLTISNVEAADEGFYYCKATNIYDNTDSAHAKLEMEKLLAHWTLDSPLVANQYKDETGNHNADPNNPAGVNFTAGIIGGALGAVEMNDERWANAGSWRPNEYNGQMTVSAWIKVPDTNDITGDGQGIVSKRVGDELDWALYVRGGDAGHPGGNYVRFTSWDDGDIWAGPDAVGEDWVFVTATVDGDGAGRLYINGAEQVVDDTWVYGTNEAAEILIGKGSPTNYVFPGLIDDVKIYNYARDKYEVAADYTDVAGGRVCVEDYTSDYNGDCEVNLADIAELGLIWQNCNLIPTSACQ
jgi:hypothetical protein